MKKIYSTILQQGLRQFKFKNSKFKPINQPDEETKGSIFGYRTKEDMVHARGVVLTSLEAVQENQKSFTHWTPNVYRYGAYSDENRRITKGHCQM